MMNRPLDEQVSARMGKMIRELRQAHDLSMDDLAKKTGISKGTISHIELGRYDPKLSTLLALAKAFRVGLERLIGQK